MCIGVCMCAYILFKTFAQTVSLCRRYKIQFHFSLSRNRLKIEIKNENFLI